MKFSVLMSVYAKETVTNLSEALDSVLNQTRLPDEIVIVIDGPVPNELKVCLEKYRDRKKDMIKLVWLMENRGLGLALAEGVKKCQYDLIARMDSDDICVKNRFELQLREFEKTPNIDIIGGYIQEFVGNVDNIVSERKVPLAFEKIKRYQKKRDAFNHVTVMFKKNAVLAAGNYQHALLMEDSLLWCNMLKRGCVGRNIDMVLVYVRTGNDMIKRRGGWEYFLKYRMGRKQILETEYINYWDYISTVIAQFIVSLTPVKLRYIIFTKILR